MGLKDKLETKLGQSLLLLPLLTILAGCGVHRKIDFERTFPEIKSQYFSCYCEPVLIKDNRGKHWRSTGYFWFFPPKERTEADFTTWYGEYAINDYLKAAEDCDEFFKFSYKKVEEHLKKNKLMITPSGKIVPAHK